MVEEGIMVVVGMVVVGMVGIGAAVRRRAMSARGGGEGGVEESLIASSV